MIHCAAQSSLSALWANSRGELLYDVNVVTVDREIPVRLLRVKREAKDVYGGPLARIARLGRTRSRASTREFQPMANGSYVVRGTLTDASAEVWLADSHGKRAGKVVPT